MTGPAMADSAAADQAAGPARDAVVRVTTTAKTFRNGTTDFYGLPGVDRHARSGEFVAIVADPDR